MLPPLDSSRPTAAQWVRFRTTFTASKPHTIPTVMAPWITSTKWVRADHTEGTAHRMDTAAPAPMMEGWDASHGITGPTPTVLPET